MGVFVLAAKSSLAVMLLAAGGAKLADLASFAATVRLFLFFRVTRPAVRWIATGIALTEAALGAASLSSPAAGWLNPLVFALACGFVVVSVGGYVLHRGRSCHCFGALSARKFDAAAVARSAAIAAAAALSIVGVRPAYIDVAPGTRAALLLAGAVVALAAFTAARSLAAGRELGVVRQ